MAISRSHYPPIRPSLPPQSILKKTKKQAFINPKMRSQLVAQNTAKTIMIMTLVLITIVSKGTFHSGLVGSSSAVAANGMPQQLATLGLWCIVIFVSIVAPKQWLLQTSTNTILIISFYGFVVLSVIWSNYSSGSALKAAVLSLTTYGAYCYATRLSIEEITHSLFLGHFILLLLSVFFALVIPSIGVLNTWQHKGQWNGIFESKQTLGISAAFLIFLALQRGLNAQNRLFYIIAFLLGVLCLIGSGSRGGALMALLGLVLTYSTHVSPLFSRVIAGGPLLIIFIASLLITTLFFSTVPYFDVMGEKVHLTERTYIWHYAISHLTEHPILGYGLNGFWTDDQILYLFKRQYGWVLDNYHNGFIAILIETGVIGTALFILTYFVNMFSLRNSAKQSWHDPYRYNMIVSATTLNFFINLTETSFLRSTNISSIIVVILLFASVTYPATSTSTHTATKKKGES